MSKTNSASQKAALSHAKWMAQAPTPMPVFLKDQTVQIYGGCNWIQGRVILSSAANCLVNLSRGDRMVKICDARCIRTHGKSNNE